MYMRVWICRCKKKNNNCSSPVYLFELIGLYRVYLGLCWRRADARQWQRVCARARALIVLIEIFRMFVWPRFGRDGGGPPPCGTQLRMARISQPVVSHSGALHREGETVRASEPMQRSC